MRFDLVIKNYRCFEGAYIFLRSLHNSVNELNTQKAFLSAVSGF